MNALVRISLVGLAACLVAPAPSAAELEVDGVVSVTPVLEHSCIAIELQAAPGSTIAGVKWFHNDSGVEFPSLLLMEGEGNTPPDLSQVALVLDEITGESLAWGEVTLDEPVVTQTGIVYAIFELPAFEERTGIGANGGPGIGYTRKDVALPAFLSGDAMHWVQLNREVQLEVELVLAGASRSAIAPRSFSEARGSRPTGWWDDLGSGQNIATAEATAEQDAPSLVHAGRRLAAVPNPFNPRTEVHFFVSRAGKVELAVYDVRGRLVDRLVHEDYAPGAHSITWNGTDRADRSVASGVYYLRMESPDGPSDFRVTLVR